MHTPIALAAKQRPESDQAVYAHLHRRYAQALVAYATRRTGRVDVAEDLVADVFVSALARKATRSVPEDALRAWLYRCTSNGVAKWIRQEGVRRRARARLAALAKASETERSDDMSLVQDLFRALPNHEQEVLALHVGCGLSIAQTAASLGASDGTVRSRLSRARARLRALADRAEGSA